MGFGEFGGGAFDIAFEGVGGGEATVMGRYGGNGRARSFEPEDRVVGARLQQMRSANLAVPPADARIAGAKADGLLRERDRLVRRTGVDPAPAEPDYCVHLVAIQRERRLVFGNGLLASALRAQHGSLGMMGIRIAGRRCQGLADQPFRTCEVGCDRVGQSIGHAACEHDRQPALSLDGLRVERQRALE